jgi:hypothetical protein
MNDDPRMPNARERLIEEREEQGRPFSDVVKRGIRSGQWDKGDLVRKHISTPQ